MVAPLRLLIVEDHDALREALSEVLRAAGHHVTVAESAEAVAELPTLQPYDIAVLDLNLPGEDGLSLAARLRQVQAGIGIVMLTVRDALPEKLSGYAHGADLYLAKPVAPEELLSALQALARRLRPDATPGNLPAGAYRLDLRAALLHGPQGPLSLREPEAAVLHALALAPEGRLENWQLLQALDKALDDKGKAQLEVLISRLRARLEAHGLPPRSIRAERGRGYCLGFVLTLV
jgi:DNA-binding response OmpR family regulator